ncbi:MAG: tRNA (N(6)-L-threonylcarbamoyladenosine(37)-C(2))-methylthiotransferase MtaB [Oscillospiraceae bacterium]|nr:tRNA (N(6)-L-threonylcarbamoyladenosine(37)-C(2))-methylthiotransferase MtaB [Oscillospiraceae bacterium]
MKYAITTLGCKVNQFESQAIETLLRSRGHQAAGEGDADVVIVNTCAVTAESGRKSRQTIRRMLKEHPGAFAAVCGCWSQLSPEDAAELGARVIYGSGDRAKFVDAVEAAASETAVDDPFRRREIEALPAGALEGRTRAYLRIEDGCDNFCSYCVIPYARGRVRSMALSDVAAEAARLAGEGFRELVVTGIEIASYGKDLPDRPNLADAVRSAADAAPGLRLRLGSLEPRVVTEAFCFALADCGSVCPHFHLSLQSGCDRTLAAMKRKYDSARFAESAALLRSAFPGCALTADLIVGFPGETEEDFAATLELIRSIGFAAMHIFPYSPRPGTPAAAMAEQLPKAEKEARARRAKAVARTMQRSYLTSQVGRTLPVLFETREADGRWQGHSDNYCLVSAKGESLHGIMKNVKILSVEGQKLIGIIV